MDAEAKHIIFDFDGVIADTFALAFETQKELHPTLDTETYRKCFEGNVHLDLASDQQVCKHTADFFKLYVERVATEATLFPGIKEVIEALSQKGKLYIISSSTTAVILPFLDKHNLTHCFDQVLGADVHLSKVEKMKMILARDTVTPDTCVFITDTLGDLREAEKMLSNTIAVTWGFHNAQVLNQGVYRSMVSTPAELLSHI